MVCKAKNNYLANLQHLTYKKDLGFEKLQMLIVTELFNDYIHTPPIRSHSSHLTSHHQLTERQNSKKSSI